MLGVDSRDDDAVALAEQGADLPERGGLRQIVGLALDDPEQVVELGFHALPVSGQTEREQQGPQTREVAPDGARDAWVLDLHRD